ncbi:MAG: OmpA family protein [Vicingaceae bacterium]
MKQTSLLILALGIIGMTKAQEKISDNLVPNPSFEILEKRVKEAGQVTYAAPWRAATMNPIDLYSADAKSDEFGVPKNKYGAEEAKTGINYAGVSFYGYRGRQPRTYLETQLVKKLEAGKEYCVKFHISLSDMSKYASNNISAHLSKEEINEMSEANLKLEPHVQSITNKIYQQQFLWKEVCSKYKAEGGEQFLTIGNFKSDDETRLEKIRLSREFSGRQFYDAYYFVDDVSVIAMDKLEEGDCMCDEIAGGQMEVEYKSFGSTADQKDKAKKTTLYNSDGSVGKNAEGKVESKKSEVGKEADSAPTDAKQTKKEEKKGFDVNDVSVFFNAKKSAPKAEEEAKLEKIAAFMKKNPKSKLQIIGHADPSESSVAFLGKRRGLAIEKKMKALGIAESRLSYISKETEMPHSSGKAEMNQRVTFSLK